MKPAAKPRRSRTVAIIQARMSSTRLPGKVLEKIGDKPMLWHVVERTRRAKQVDEVIVATSTKAADKPIVDFCRKHQIPVELGSETDVLDRFYQASKAHQADTIVRITSDCPFVDPTVIDLVINKFHGADFDYASNTGRYTFPEGLDTEVFSFHALERAWQETQSTSDREHVTPYLRTSGKFKTLNVENTKDLSSLNLRWSVDSEEDLNFARQVFEGMSKRDSFGMDDILTFLQKKPTLKLIQGNQPINEGYYRSLYQEAEGKAAPKRSITESQKWYLRSKKVIPGAAQTFSKSTQQFVQGVSPIFLQRGSGCRSWDVDGNMYIDYVQGLLPNILGYANPEVNAVVAKQAAEGHSFSLPHPIEVELAEKLTKVIPCAEMVRFGKNGSDATSGAVRAARAFTQRDRVIVCGYHGWQDWYIGSTTRSQGVPGAVRALTHSVPYNDIEKIQALFKQYPREIAAVILEPVNFTPPKPDYFSSLREITKEEGSVLIFDEMCTGFHFGLGGAHKKFGVMPDLACFGKAMGNGFPISCIVGRRDIMKFFEQIFFSFTLAGEAASMAAALKVIDVLENTDAIAKLEATGRKLQEGFNTLAKQAGLYPRFECIGYPNWTCLKFKTAEGTDGLLERSLFQQEAIKRGILILTTHNLSTAHDEQSTEQTLRAYASVLKTIQPWLADKNPARFLEGPMIEPIFKVRG